MKVTLTSDVTKKEYSGDEFESVLAEMKSDEEKFLKEAEKQKLEEEKSLAKAEQNKALTAQKKELCQKIDQSFKNIESAEQRYDKIYEEAQKAVKEARAEAEKIVNKAIADGREKLRNQNDEIVKAQKEHQSLILEYKNSFGRPYTKIYELSDEEAKKEYERMIHHFNTLFDTWFPFRLHF